MRKRAAKEIHEQMQKITPMMSRLMKKGDRVIDLLRNSGR